MKKRSLSIRFYIPAVFLAFALIMLALLWILEVGMLDELYKKTKLDNISKIGSTIAREITSPDLQQYLDQLSQTNEVCAYISDSKNILMKGEIPCAEPTWMEFYYRISNAQTSPFNTFIEERPINEYVINVSDSQLEARPATQIRYTQMIVNEQMDQPYYLFINSTITPLSTTVETLQKILMIVTLIMIAAALVLGSLLSFKFTRPITAINKKAKLLGKQDDLVFDGHGYRESQELSTTLTQVNKELRTVEKLRNELIANISHDLRTPLTMISGYAEMMRDLPDENTPENLQTILDECHYLTRLVNDVLDLSKLQAGAMKLNITHFNLSATLHNILNRVEEMNDINLVREINEEVYVDGDEMKISQVFYNFLSNALHYIGEDKMIIVRQIVSKDKVRIEIEDHGCGIKEEELDKVWDSYYRTNNDHTRSITGTGLGLHIVKQILDLHHANYGVKSKFNEGSTFFFEINL